MSVAYVAKGKGVLKAGSDASKAYVASLDNMPSMLFDHNEMLEKYIEYKMKKQFEV